MKPTSQPAESITEGGKARDVADGQELFDRGASLRDEMRLDEALSTFDVVLDRFGESPDPGLRALAARALARKGEIFYRTERLNEALATCEELEQRYGSDDASAILEQVAVALVNKAVTLRTLSRTRDALSTIDEIVHRYGESTDPDILGTVAKALCDKGAILEKMNRADEAIAVYGSVARRFGASRDTALHQLIATALLNKAAALGESDRHEEALSMYDEIVTRFVAADSEPLVETVAIAMCNMGIALARLGRHDQAIRTFDRAIDAFDTSDAPVLVEMVAKCWLNKGYALSALDRPIDAVAVFERADCHARDADRASTHALAAHALVKQGLVLAELERPAEALPVYEEVIRRHDSSEDGELCRLVAMAFLNKGGALATLNRADEAVEAFDAVVRRYGANEPLPVLESVAKALVNKAAVLFTVNRRQEAIYVSDEVIQRFGEQESPLLAHMVADAIYLKGGALLELQRPMEALASFTGVLEQSSKAEPSAIPGLQVKALLGRGLAFDKLGKTEDALAICDEVVARFGEHTDPWVLGPVASALARKVSILGAAWHQKEALAVHEELVRRIGSVAPSYQELIERYLIEKAEFHFIAGRFLQAIEAADLALERCLTDSLENKLRILAIRVKARLADDDVEATEGDIVEILSSLGDLRALPKDILDALMEFSLDIGCERMRELIEASPSAVLLMALSTALVQEEGLRPRVAREMEEVAADIRTKLKSLKQVRALKRTDDNADSRGERAVRTNGIVIKDKLSRSLPISHGPIRLAVTGEDGLKSQSWKIWMDKSGEIYFSLREPNPDFKVSLHCSGKQHIKMANEYWGQWHEPENYTGPTVMTSTKLVFPGWGMRTDANLTRKERDRWNTNEIEIKAAEEGRVLALAVVIRTGGQQLKQEGGKSETLAIWRRPDGKEAHLIVSEEGERNLGDLVLHALSNESCLRFVNDSVQDGKIDENSVLSATLTGPPKEGENYFMCVSIKIKVREGVGGKEYIPTIVGLEASNAPFHDAR